MISKTFSLIFAGIAMLVSAAVRAGGDADMEYHPGQGWRLGDSGFNLGGYASGGLANDHHQPWQLGVHDLSLFVRWEGEGRLRLFSEFDLEDPFIVEEHYGVTVRQAYLAMERLYADYYYSERLNLRAGKFLTPIGRWNVIHADPLVWTTTRPLITERSFPTNATGAMVYGTLPVLGQEMDYSVYAAIGDDWRPDPSLDPFSEAYGFHVNLPMAGAGELGFSYSNFEQKGAEGDRRKLIGLDYLWSRDRFEISSELVYRLSDEGHHSDERGLYLQVVAPLSERWYGIARYELYDHAGPAATLNLGVLGVAMKISPALIFKAEYSHASKNQVQAPEGFYSSFAILF